MSRQLSRFLPYHESVQLAELQVGLVVFLDAEGLLEAAKGPEQRHQR